MARVALTMERITATAIELLDDEGLDGLNMRALGKRLDVAATAVYWHVRNKDDLVRVVGDEVWAEVALPDLDAPPWRTAAKEMAFSLHGMLGRHPWLVQAFGSHLFYGDRKARHDAHLLALYEKAGFTSAAADRASATVFTFVLGNVLGASAATTLTRRLTRQGRDPEKEIGEFMEQATLVASRYPELRSRLKTPGAEFAEAPERTFEYGLDSLFDAFEAQLDTERSGADPTAS
ncbi:TetR/AcrR family transcriptional regulator C-terminal domain-containing protein [Streptomyces sp. NPDC047981]|uniref:TetR/AcrR family transcriptional regulator n=1 Tax=Streptomyces sp. NPDC047981 TaxID=3154610 RepID=UPI00341EA824